MHQEKRRNMHVSYNLSNILLFFFFFFIMMIISLLNHSSNAAEQDFCVADLKAQEGPVGFLCKNVTQVTSDDFTFRNFPRPQQTFPPPISLSLSYGFKEQYPAINGLRLGILFLTLRAGGVVPLHTHPRGNEVIFVIQGKIIAGFISSDNKAFYTTLNEGDTYVFPQGLLHFQVNVGNNTGKILASLSSSNPGLQITTTSIAGNDLPTDIVEKVTFLDDPQVRKLKAWFGGTN